MPRLQSPMRRHHALLRMLIAVLIVAAAATLHAQTGLGWIVGDTHAQRAQTLVAYCAQTQPRNERSLKEGMAFYTARLIVGSDIDEALRKIDAALDAALRQHADRSVLDPFDLHAVMNGYLICPDRYPASTVEKIRRYAGLWSHEKWLGYGALNYRLMKDGSGFLAAERWPDLRDAEGLTAEQVRKATGDRLLTYFDTIVRRNLDEYNAPIYFTTDLMAMRMIAEFARDPVIRQRATLTLDWMLVNLACSWNQGYYVTTAGRSKYWAGVRTGPDHPGPTPAVGYLFFGGLRPIAGSSTGAMHTFWLAYPGSYELPAIVTRIAQDRAEPFVNRESVLAAPYALAAHLSPPSRQVRKYTWHTPTYSLASQWEGGIKQHTDGFFKETKRHMMKWISDKPVSTLSFQQENPERPYRMKDNRKNAFGYGENPFHQILQHQGTQVGIYDVPASYPYYKMYVPFPATGSIVRRIERDGWIFCHGGSVLFAFRMIKPGAWGRPQYECDVLWSEARVNGWVLETSPVEPFRGSDIDATLRRFADAVLNRTRIDAELDAAPPRLAFTSLIGDKLSIVHKPLDRPYTSEHQVNGKPIDYASYPLMGNPWVRQDVDGSRLALTHGKEELLYDFARWQRTSSAVQRLKSR